MVRACLAMPPFLAHGQGLLLLLAGTGVGFLCILVGIVFWFSKQSVRRRTGTRLLLSGLAIILAWLLFLMFAADAARLFRYR